MGRRRPGSHKRVTSRISLPRSSRVKQPKLSSGTDPNVLSRWDSTATVQENYDALGLLLRPNDIDRTLPEGFIPVELHVPPSVTGRKPTLSDTEVAYFVRLVRKYGDDFEAMARDIRLNRNQLTVRQLEKKCTLLATDYSQFLFHDSEREKRPRTEVWKEERVQKKMALERRRQTKREQKIASEEERARIRQERWRRSQKIVFSSEEESDEGAGSSSCTGDQTAVDIKGSQGRDGATNLAEDVSSADEKERGWGEEEGKGKGGDVDSSEEGESSPSDDDDDEDSSSE